MTEEEGAVNVTEVVPARFDDLTGLAYETLRTEGRVGVLLAVHPPADRAALTLGDLQDEVFFRWIGVESGTGAGPEVADTGQLFPLLAVGRAIAVLPASLVTPAPPGVVCVPVEDAEPSDIVVAHSARDDRAAVRSFIDTCVAHRHI